MQQCILSIRETLRKFWVVTLAFQGKGGGPALLMFAGTIEEWNAKIVETLITSVR